MSGITPKIGQTVRTKDGRQGIVRYAGKIHAAIGDWLGLELPDASGKNDGSVKGERYFTCPPGHGIFVRKESVESIVQDTPKVSSAPNINDEAKTPAGGTGIAADVTRKRQSLMSAASARPSSARLSVRSPTKSPTKGMRTSMALPTSVSRTSTPAATSRLSDSSTKSRPSLAPRPSIAPSNASSTSVVSNATPTVRSARPSIGTTKSSLSSSRLTQRNVPQVRPKQTQAGTPKSTGLLVEQTPADKKERQSGYNTAEATEQIQEGPSNDDHEANHQFQESTVKETVAARARQTSISRNNATMVESRLAQQREIEELKVRLRSMETQQQEYREKMQHLDSVQSERDKYEKIVQALQKKLRTNQQDMTELRSQYAEAEDKIKSIEAEYDPDHQLDSERLVLDKNAAEDRVEALESELALLKEKHEELEVDFEIMTEMKQELESRMSPEDRADAGYVQAKQENQRLRDALVRLRDVTQDTEADLRTELEELRTSVREAEGQLRDHSEAKEELRRLKTNNLHLMEQLEAADTNDEVVEALETQQQQQLITIEQLRKQVQELEEEQQITEELESFYLDEERRLHIQLDDAEAQVNDTARRNIEQERIIEDLEYTLNKFKDVVRGLHNDLEELRRSKDISEREALDMSSKSRAMMDLNLKLQSNAAKTQAKTIETELIRVQAQLSTRHVEILNLFALESYDAERNSVAVLLCFGRIKSKAELVTKLLNDRHRERGHLSSGSETFETFSVIESVQWIQGMCQQFEEFLRCCSHAEFAACGQALLELEPVERSVTSWLEALRRDEISVDGPEHLKRMQEILLDLAEKLLSQQPEYKILDVQRRLQLVENSSEEAANMFTTLAKLVQSRLGTSSDEVEDQDMQTFDRKMNYLSTKARTLKYTASKVVQQVHSIKSRSRCPAESDWIVFEDTERQTRYFVRQVKQLCLAVIDQLLKADQPESLSYSSVIDVMHQSWSQHGDSASNGHKDDALSTDGFTPIITRLVQIQSAVDDLAGRLSGIDSMMEFERSPAPWVIRSKELRAQKVIPPDVQEEITALDRRNNEMALRIAERDTKIEEMLLRVEIAEKRAKDLRSRDNDDRALKEETQSLRAEKEAAEKTLIQLRSQYESQRAQIEADRAELEALRASGPGTGGIYAGTNGIVDDQTTAQLRFDNSMLLTEKTSLEAAVRFLQSENHSLRIPVTETLISAAKYSWLDSSLFSTPLRTQQSRQITTSSPKRLESERADLYSSLIDAASSLKPIRLSLSSTTTTNSTVPGTSKTNTVLKPSSWQPRAQTTRHTVLRQREQLETWDAWRADILARAKIAGRTNRAPHSDTRGQLTSRRPRPRDDGSNLTVAIDMGIRDEKATGIEGMGDVVRIVE